MRTCYADVSLVYEPSTSAAGGNRSYEKLAADAYFMAEGQFAISGAAIRREVS